jgi:hypothetical protein
MKTAVGIVVALVSCAQAHGATPSAQTAAVSVGSRVRITSGPGGQPTIGTVAALEADAVVLRHSRTEALLRLPVAEIQMLEVSSGRKSQAGRGAMMGAAIGAMPGVLLTFGDYSDDVHGDGPSPAAVVTMGAAGGVLVGAAIGWALKTERWLPGEVPKAGVAFTPLRGGAKVSFRMTWGKGARAGT